MKENFKKTFLLHKINLSNHKNYEKEIRNQFENIENYFDTSNKVIIGKKINFSSLNEIPEAGGRGGGFRRTMRMKKTMKSEDLNCGSPNGNQKTPYEILDDNSIKQYFEQIKQLSIKNNNQKSLNKSLKYLPTNIQKNLRYQQNSLNNKKNNDNHVRSLSNYLISKTKKDQKQLLLNTINEFQIKRGIIKTIDNSVPFDKKYGVYNWNVSLRRPKNFVGTRTSMINIGTNSNPFWAIIREKNPSENEFVVKTEGNSYKNNIQKYKKLRLSTDSNNKMITGDQLTVNNYYYNTVATSSINDQKKIDILNDINTLSLCGKNLLNLEYDSALNMKGKILLKKKDVSNSNNNVTQLLHEKYYHETNNSDETIIENYHNKGFPGETSTSQTHLFC